MKDPDVFMEGSTDEKVGIGEETGFGVKVGEDIVLTGTETVGDGLTDIFITEELVNVRGWGITAAGFGDEGADENVDKVVVDWGKR